MTHMLTIAAAGALGALARYLVSGWTGQLLGGRAPLGTLAVNVIGSFLLGLLLQVGLTEIRLSKTLQLALTVGFLGSFTTFSTFSLDTLQFLQARAWLPAAAYVAANLLLSLAAAWAGVVVARG